MATDIRTEALKEPVEVATVWFAIFRAMFSELTEM
jgi:hypothetical protein